MAIYYADLDLTGIGGDGSEGNPWHADSFQSQLNNLLLNSGSVVKVKGSHEWVGTADNNIFVEGLGNTPITIENWGTSPWRISCLNFSIKSGSTVKNGIVNMSDITGSFGIYAGGTASDCYFIGGVTNSFNVVSGPLNTIKGCTIVVPMVRAGDGCAFFPVDFIDTIIACSTIQFFSSASSTNCCWTIGAIPGGGVHTNAQTGWTAPSWPAWNAVQSAFASSLLSAGILSDPPSGSSGKPNPGNPPYTGYATGLWGTSRIGIGAMDFPAAILSSFNVPSAGDNTSVTSSVNPSALVSLIQAVYPGDTYFDSTSEVGPVYVYYTHSAGRQQKRLVHDPVNHQASVQWSSYAQDGTWQKTKIKAFDKDGAFVYLDRSSIGTGEDLIHSDGTIYLNT